MKGENPNISHNHSRAYLKVSSAFFADIFWSKMTSDISFSFCSPIISRKSGQVLEVRVSVSDLHSLGSSVASRRSRDTLFTVWRSRRHSSSRTFNLISAGNDCKLAF